MISSRYVFCIISARFFAAVSLFLHRNFTIPFEKKMQAKATTLSIASFVFACTSLSVFDPVRRKPLIADYNGSCGLYGNLTHLLKLQHTCSITPPRTYVNMFLNIFLTGISIESFSPFCLLRWISFPLPCSKIPVKILPSDPPDPHNKKKVTTHCLLLTICRYLLITFLFFNLRLFLIFSQFCL